MRGVTTRGRILLALTAVVLLVGQAVADDIDADADLVQNGKQNIVIDACVGDPASGTTNIIAERGGDPGNNAHKDTIWAGGQNLVVTAAFHTSGGDDAKFSLNGTTVALPANWTSLPGAGNNRGTASNTVSVDFLGAPAAGTYKAQLVYTASGTNIETPPQTFTKTTTVVGVTAKVSDEGDCAPSSDTESPAVTVSFTPNGLNGWFVSNPAVGSVTATDNVGVTEITCTGATLGAIAGLGTTSATASLSVSAEGSSSVSCTAKDAAGNTGSDSEDVKVDSIAPVVSVTGVADGSGYTLGSVPSAGCSTTDATPGSGVDTPASVSVTGGTLNGVGTFFATCSGATDVAGNSGNTALAKYYVAYGGVSGILEPINPDKFPTATFKRGQSVPVKFRLGGDEGTAGYNTSGWTIQRVLVNCSSLDPGAAEDVPSNTPSTTFRYDGSADQYIYNADFRSAAAGSCWRIVVTLDDANAPAGTPTTLTSATFRVTR